MLTKEQAYQLIEAVTAANEYFIKMQGTRETDQTSVSATKAYFKEALKHIDIASNSEDVNQVKRNWEIALQYLGEIARMWAYLMRSANNGRTKQNYKEEASKLAEFQANYSKLQDLFVNTYVESPEVQKAAQMENFKKVVDNLVVLHAVKGATLLAVRSSKYQDVGDTFAFIDSYIELYNDLNPDSPNFIENVETVFRTGEQFITRAERLVEETPAFEMTLNEFKQSDIYLQVCGMYKRIQNVQVVKGRMFTYDDQPQPPQDEFHKEMRESLSVIYNLVKRIDNKVEQILAWGTTVSPEDTGKALPPSLTDFVEPEESLSEEAVKKLEEVAEKINELQIGCDVMRAKDQDADRKLVSALISKLVNTWTRDDIKQLTKTLSIVSNTANVNYIAVVDDVTPVIKLLLNDGRSAYVHLDFDMITGQAFLKAINVQIPPSPNMRCTLDQLTITTDMLNDIYKKLLLVKEFILGKGGEHVLDYLDGKANVAITIPEAVKFVIDPNPPSAVVTPGLIEDQGATSDKPTNHYYASIKLEDMTLGQVFTNLLLGNNDDPTFVVEKENLLCYNVKAVVDGKELSYIVNKEPTDDTVAIYGVSMKTHTPDVARALIARMNKIIVDIRFAKEDQGYH